MSQPLPIHGIRNGEINAGTGFLVKNNNDFWLVTCAHVITGLANTPPLLQYFEGGYINVLEPTVSIQLFEAGEKRFRIVNNPTYGVIVDALSVKLKANEVTLLQHVDAFELQSIVSAEAGEQVTVNGFPGMQFVPIEASSHQAAIVEGSGENFKLSEPSAHGYSGGPVSSDKGLVGIATADVGHESALTNGLVTRLDIIKAVLFQ